MKGEKSMKKKTSAKAPVNLRLGFFRSNMALCLIFVLSFGVDTAIEGYKFVVGKRIKNIQKIVSNSTASEPPKRSPNPTHEEPNEHDQCRLRF